VVDATEPQTSDDLVGTPIHRREDRHLLTGDARYTDDIQDHAGLDMAIHRSQYGHARVESVDVADAAEMPGVVAVYTRDDLVAAGLNNVVPGDDRSYAASVERPILAGDRVRFQGEPIAAVVAEDRYTAHDAADAVDVEYERLDPVTDPGETLDEDAPTLHDGVPDNTAFEWEGGDAEAVERAFASAADRVSIDLSINRVAAVPMETRAAVARYRGDELTVEMSTQNPHSVQDDLETVLGIPEHRITVRVPDVGGAFGVKLQAYPGHLLVAWAATQLKRPVSWAATRTEAFTSTNHARAHDLTASAALDDDGKIVAFRFESVADVGAYLSQGGALVPTLAFGTRLMGQYDVPAAHVRVTGAFTNTVPLAAYRGAGRPEAAYAVERLARACARELDEDPVEFRRRNFIDPDRFPYETPFGTSYDSGDYEKSLEKALEYVDYERFRERQRAARENGRYLGIGFSTYIEICGGSSRGVEGGLVRMTPGGKVHAHTGTVDLGQGHRTSYAQIVADELGVEYDDVQVIEGDTDRVPEGGGTAGSRSMPMGGNALRASARKVREKARQVAADKLEASPEDVEFDDGRFHVAGAPDRSIEIRDVASSSYSGSVPEAARGLEDTTFFSPEGSTAPFGTHIAIVEVDPDTGDVEFERYVAVDDVGTQINPKLVEGQIVGGIVQSIGQAIYEQARYDDAGNLVTSSLQDYALPRADDVPEIEWDSTVTPSPNNPLGVKGVGEAGTIAALPAIVNATVDALEPFGVENLDMPLTPESVWRTIHGHDGR